MVGSIGGTSRWYEINFLGGTDSKRGVGDAVEIPCKVGVGFKLKEPKVSY